MVIVIFFGLNYSWTHAAFAKLSIGSTCSKNLTSGAKNAVIEFFGDAKSSPIFICLNEPILGINTSHGSTQFAPLLPSIIILGPQGHNLDVASHEYVHAELAARTSVLLRTYQIPTWFDEGVAMQLDHRPDYSQKALREYLRNTDNTTLTLNSIKDPNSFYQKDLHGKIHYAFSRCVVSRWLFRNGQKELLNILEKINWAQTLPSDVFEKYVTHCLSSV